MVGAAEMARMARTININRRAMPKCYNESNCISLSLVNHQYVFSEIYSRVNSRVLSKVGMEEESVTLHPGGWSSIRIGALSGKLGSHLR